MESDNSIWMVFHLIHSYWMTLYFTSITKWTSISASLCCSHQLASIWGQRCFNQASLDSQSETGTWSSFRSKKISEASEAAASLDLTHTSDQAYTQFARGSCGWCAKVEISCKVRESNLIVKHCLVQLFVYFTEFISIFAVYTAFSKSSNHLCIYKL